MGTKYLITGSREATQSMLSVTIRLVGIIHKRGGSLIVGDAPGVDQCAIRHAEKLGVPTTVYAGYNQCRASHNGQVEVILTGVSYGQRDKLMVEQADVVLCVWNGYSKGAKLNHDYARRLGKMCWIRQFGSSTRFRIVGRCPGGVKIRCVCKTFWVPAEAKEVFCTICKHRVPMRQIPVDWREVQKPDIREVL